MYYLFWICDLVHFHDRQFAFMQNSFAANSQSRFKINVKNAKLTDQIIN